MTLPTPARLLPLAWAQARCPTLTRHPPPVPPPSMQMLSTDHEPARQVAMGVPVMPLRQAEVQVSPSAAGSTHAKSTALGADG
jgi:hypothetical protein